MWVRILEKKLRSVQKSVLLLGARQVGKSTLAKKLGPDLSINLADEPLFLSHSRDPGLLKREVSALKSSKPGLILIDEIQRIPSLLNSVQALLDEGMPHRFLLTGSSSRKLKRGGANLLPGRVILEYLDPLSIWELGKDFDLEMALKRGTLPGIYLDKADGPEILGSYASVYLKEEIQVEAVAKNIGDYARFLEVAAEASGDWINYSKISSDAEVPKETVRRFFTLLEDTLIAFRISSFKPRQSKRRTTQRDRFIFFDVGVRNALLGLHRSEQSSSEKGKLFEQWCLLQCLFYMRSFKKDWKLTSYRTDSGSEVDIIIETPKKLIAIECKYGSQVNPSMMRGLRSFEKIAHKPVEKYLISRTPSRQKFSQGELALPYLEFFFELLPTF